MSKRWTSEEDHLIYLLAYPIRERTMTYWTALNLLVHHPLLLGRSREAIRSKLKKKVGKRNAH